MTNRTFRLLAYRLLERHQKLDAALRDAQARRWADPFEIARLKKLKLMIKDRLARLARPQRLSTGG
ncbi:YdcH family protein [Novosphingobium huizhouense]|uniref:YdcH family protein n=1 Tax=Novosphingobium huizhouense TaxID=2866625 RepID=UPI001CD89D50|nr:YdcH family protein [Novosphingobium huizhouense]